MPIAHYPHQIVEMDIVGPLPRSRSGHNYLLTFIDHLTGWADAFPISHKTGSKVANVLPQCYLPQYGLPEVILSDNGLEFCNAEVHGLLRQYGIKHKKSTIYHPQSNGRVERYHRFLKSILRKFTCSSGSSWIDRIGPALMFNRNMYTHWLVYPPFKLSMGVLVDYHRKIT